jgi:hypothetical protein
MIRRILAIAGLLVLLLCAWILLSLTNHSRRDLRRFDGREVGRLETAMWRSYYDHRDVRLFGELISLLRQQYHLPFWRATAGAYHAARAAVVFQRGHGRPEFMLALPDIEHFYTLIRENSSTSFDVKKVSALELEWWIVHRERAHRNPADLVNALAALQAEIYHVPAARFAEHAKARADAMLIRDAQAEAGGVSQADWSCIEALLERSWVSLQNAVS